MPTDNRFDPTIPPEPLETDVRIAAHPTKEFFIFMLVKDIGLIRSILDLVDNCVDGAKRLRSDGDFKGLRIDIIANDENLSIDDTCGGIPVDVAKKYAFRFGRPKEMPQTTHSVGQFGVGMKRSIFKLGCRAHILSATEDGEFTVDIDVDNWLVDPNNWNFEFSRVSSRESKTKKEDGTLIRVDKLHESVSKDLALENFQSRLKDEIELAHQNSIERGLSIRLNNVLLKSMPSELLISEELKPVFKRIEFQAEESPISVRIYCGLAEGNPSAAGWTIFCNDRMVLNADQSWVTGWGEGKGRTIPKYHNTFARFRGFAFFDSDVTSSLPWNTTKTGVDVDSDIYQSVRLEMITLMRPVLDFLNQLASERTEEATDPGPLEQTVATAELSRLDALVDCDSFIAPRRIVRQESNTGRIQYSKPLDEIQVVQNTLGVSTYKDVGEKTFEYFLRMECT